MAKPPKSKTAQYTEALKANTAAISAHTKALKAHANTMTMLAAHTASSEKKPPPPPNAPPGSTVVSATPCDHGVQTILVREPDGELVSYQDVPCS
jgi:hypothetical protein